MFDKPIGAPFMYNRMYNHSLCFVFDIEFELIIDDYHWINLVIHKIKPRSNTGQEQNLKKVSKPSVDIWKNAQIIDRF